MKSFEEFSFRIRDSKKEFNINIEARNHHEARMYAIARNPYAEIISLRKKRLYELFSRYSNYKRNYIIRMKKIGTEFNEYFEESIQAISYHEARMYAIARNPFSPIVSIHKSNFQEISNRSYNPQTNYVARIKKIGVYRFEDFSENIQARNFDEAKMYAIARHPFAPLVSLTETGKETGTGKGTGTESEFIELRDLIIIGSVYLLCMYIFFKTDLYTYSDDDPVLLIGAVITTLVTIHGLYFKYIKK